MDEETNKAIEEAMNIFHKNAQEQQEAGTTPVPTTQSSLVDEQEQPANQEHDEREQHPQEPGETEERTRPGSKRRWLSVASLIIGVVSVTLVVMLVVVPLFCPTAIVTIIPALTTIQT